MAYSDGVLMHGLILDEETGVEIPFTEQMVNKEDADVIAQNPAVADTNINPNDSKSSKVRVIDISAWEAFAAAYVLDYIGETNLNFPDVLTGVDAFVEVQTAEGMDEDDAGSASITNGGSWVISPQTSTQSSVVAMPDCDPKIRQKWGQNKKVRHLVFLMKPPVSQTQINTRLLALNGAAVSAWPNFNPETLSIFCVGGRASVQSKARAHYQAGFNTCGDCSTSEYAIHTGVGDSKELAVTIKAVRIPPTIHGGIDVVALFGSSLNDTYDVDATAYADAYLTTAGPHVVTATAVAYVTPLSINATTGAVAIPTSGYYALSPDVGLYKYGWVRYHYMIVNGADL